MECEQALSDTPEDYDSPLAEMSRALVQLLAPQSLHPADPGNVLLALEKAHATGVAELERAGYSTEGLSVYQYWFKLEYLEKKPAK